MTRLNIVGLIAVLSLLQACGSTSNIQPQNEQAKAFSAVGYDCLKVAEFGETASDTAKIKGKTAEIRERKMKAINVEALELGEKFADILVQEIRGAGAFDHVSRTTDMADKDNCLIIDGDVTGYARGNKAARLLVGFGAGSSRFDAIVNIKDQSSKNTVGKVVVDKNSWALGGFVAMGQEIEDHMLAAAKKVSTELVDATLPE